MNRDRLFVFLQRFWQKVDRSPDGCWLWRGERQGQGYGVVALWINGDRERILAHRLAHVMATGDDITDRVVMHSCDNPPCVNPDHLSVGSQLDNMRDCKTKGRMKLDGLAIGQGMSTPRPASADKTECIRGHAYTEENTYRDPKGGRRCRQCARDYDKRRRANAGRAAA